MSRKRVVVNLQIFKLNITHTHFTSQSITDNNQSIKHACERKRFPPVSAEIINVNLSRPFRFALTQKKRKSIGEECATMTWY